MEHAQSAESQMLPNVNRVVSSSTQPDRPGRWRANLPPWMTDVPMPSVLFLTSAACLLLGTGLILGPIYAARMEAADPLRAMANLVESFACIAALNAYEIALLLALGVLLGWKRAWEHSVPLAVLLGVFLVGSAATLSTVSAAHPWLSLGLALAGLLLGGLKAVVYQRLIGSALPWAVLAVGGWLLAWNFLMPALLGLAVSEGASPERMLELWLAGWRWGLMGWLGVGLGLMVLPVGGLAPGGVDPSEPTLRRPMMSWTLLLIVAAGTALHQLAIAYAFGLLSGLGQPGSLRWGDVVLPMSAAGCLIVALLLRALGRWRWLQTAVLWAPIGVSGLVVIEDGSALALWRPPYGMLTEPGVFLVIYAMGLTTLGWARVLGRGPLWVALVSLPLGVLVVGTDPTPRGWHPLSLEIQSLNWAAALGVAAMQALLSRVAFRGCPAWIGWAGALMLVLGQAVVFYQARAEATLPAMLSLLVGLLLGAIAAWRMDRPMALASGVSLLCGAYFASDGAAGWVFIAAAFVLLGLGTADALSHPDRSDANESPSPPSPSAPEPYGPWPLGEA